MSAKETVIGRREIRAVVLVASIGLVAGCTASTATRGGATIAPTDFVSIEPGVWVVARRRDPTFFAQGFYWRWDGGAWYRSIHHDRGWVRVRNEIPSRLAAIDDPGRYRHYRPTRGRAKRTGPRRSLDVATSLGPGSTKAIATGTDFCTQLPEIPRTASSLACSRRRQIIRPWTLEVAGPRAPRPAPGQVLYHAGSDWGIVDLGIVPNTRRSTFRSGISPYFTAVDGTGTVAFRGDWLGNPDQLNNIGVGIYLLRDGVPVVVADSFTIPPGKSSRLTEIGIPDIEHGAVAFWAGRGRGEWSGNYLWCDGAIVSIDGPDDVQMGGTPDLHGRRVAVQGLSPKGPATYLWSVDSGQTTRMVGKGDLMPDGKTIELVFDPLLGDDIAVIPVGYGKRGNNGVPYERRLIGWHAGKSWIIADNRRFRGPKGQEMYLSPSLAIDGNDVAFEVHAPSVGVQIWVASGCTLELIASSGDQVAGKTIRSFADLVKAPFRDGELVVLANFVDGSQSYVRLRRPRR